jgi:hypothetical protein
MRNAGKDQVPPMRPDEEYREREPMAPGGEVDPATLAEHVASCPACGAWSDASVRLDRLWEATRPAEPGPDAWARLWSEVVAGRAPDRDAAIEPEPEPATLRPAPLAAGRPRRRWLAPALAAAFVAQAAAVFLAAWVLFRDARPDGAPPIAADAIAAAPQSIVFELDEGQTLFLVLDEQGGKVLCQPKLLSTAELVAFDGESPDPYALAFQSDLEMLNAMESLE